MELDNRGSPKQLKLFLLENGLNKSLQRCKKSAPEEKVHGKNMRRIT